MANSTARDRWLACGILRPQDAPLEKTYTLPPSSRTNIWVNHEEFPQLGKALASTDVSAVIQSLDGVPIVVERAMYLSSEGRIFNAGHESDGVPAPSTDWSLAEGATGDFFDLFVLIANPGVKAADVEVRYQVPDGPAIVKTHQVPGESRRTLWVDHEDLRLGDTAVSTTVRATNGVPVVVERAMWWPGPTPATWHGAHASAGSTTTAVEWGLAEGEVGGPRGVDTYLLISGGGPGNAGVTPCVPPFSTCPSATVSLHFEDGTTASRRVGLTGRTTVSIASAFPEAADRRFGITVKSEAYSVYCQIGGPLCPGLEGLVVERSMYWGGGRGTWEAGTNALGTPRR